MKLRGRTAVITGAGRGIGEAIALAFAAEGARLVLVSRTAPALEQVARRVREKGALATTVTADVSSADAGASVVEAARREYGEIDILVNNAGVYGPIGPFAETDLDAWWRALEVNLGGTLRVTREVVPHMIAQRRGKIINLSGGGATSPLPNLTAYSVSKTAVVRLTENLAEELRPHNIQVNAIAPGTVDTRLQDQLLAAGEQVGGDLFVRIKAMRETGKGSVPPGLVAQLAVFLASDDSDAVTGKLISAPHDPWREWSGSEEELASPMYTLRRVDLFTLGRLKDRL